MLDLVFETADRYTRPHGGYRYSLYLRGGVYALPDVAAVTEEGTATVSVQDAGISQVVEPGRASSALCAHVRAAWEPAAGAGSEQHVSARRVLAGQRTVGAADVEQSRTAPREPVTVVVTWQVLYADRAGIQRKQAHDVTLEFAPADVPAPADDRRLDPDAERDGVPAPIRDITVRPRYPLFAAIDFGTSSSTVTAYDNRRMHVYNMDPAQAERLRLEFAQLLERAAPGGLHAEWINWRAALAADVGTALYGSPTTDMTALCERLRSGEIADGALDTVCQAFERCLFRSGRELKEWLGPHLLTCYDAAFSVPPLVSSYLTPVLMDEPARSYELPTTLALTQADPVAITLGADAPDARRDVKAKLLKPEPLEDGARGRDGKDATTDDLIAHAYNALIERAEAALDGEHDEERPPQAIVELVVTFPTITPPGARDRLFRLMRRTLGVTLPRVIYDEGVAAALYFLMRDFGGNRPEFGAEALRARSRRIADDPPTWQQNMLVLDIGAGTTDIALIRLTMREQDGRDGAPTAIPSSVPGKYYVISPEVVNSTGHTQLGGNYLTLRVFYWLKAVIADALLDGDDKSDERTSLRRQVAEHLGRPDDPIPLFAPLVTGGTVEHPAPRAVASALSSLLPTAWRKDAPADERTAFWQLWRLAERVKIELGRAPAPDDVSPGLTLTREAVGIVLRPIDVSQGTALRSLLPDSIRLERTDLLAVADPVLGRAAELAYWLVERALSPRPGETADPAAPSEQLDRIMLSGKTNQMPLAAEAIARVFAAHAALDGVPWNPAAISVEHDYAKQAASLGAAWAHAQYLHLADVKGEQDQLNLGRSILSVDVENVFQALPCDLELVRQQGNASPLMAAGTPLLEVDGTGRLAARREWSDERPWPTLIPTFQVARPTGPRDRQSWGTYHYERAASEERGFEPDDAVWRSGPDGRGGAIRAQVEVDERLIPVVHLSRGRPHYLIDAAGSSDLRHELPDDCRSGHDGRMCRLPFSVVLVGAPTKEAPDGAVEIFAPWRPGPADSPAAYFPEYFHEHPGLDSAAVPGRIALALPPPPADGDYRVLLRDPDRSGRDRELAPFRVPARVRRTSRYVATLDVRGRLGVHRGFPPFWRANSMRDVQVHEGSVLRCEMQPGDPDHNPDWDPFTGKH